MNNIFELEFDNTITKLAGNKLGKIVFRKQVKDNIDYNQPIKIIFPDRIDTIASSFIQGLFEDIVKNIGISGVEENVIISSSIPELKENILKNLM